MKNSFYFIISFLSTLTGILFIGFYTYVLLFEKDPELESYSLAVKLLGFALPIILVMGGWHFWKKARMGVGLEFFEEKHVTYRDVLVNTIIYGILVYITFNRLSPIDSQGDVWFLIVVTAVLLLDVLSKWKKAKNQ